MAFWRTQELDGDEEEKNASKEGAQGPSGVRVFGGLLASRSPFGGSWLRSHRGSTGAAHSSKPKPLAAKTGPAPVLLSLAGSSKAFSKSLLFCWSLKYSCWDLESLERRTYCRSSISDIPGLGTFFHHFNWDLSYCFRYTSYLSFFVHRHIFRPVKSTPKTA